jgi:hypothetical protein
MHRVRNFVVSKFSVFKQKWRHEKVAGGVERDDFLWKCIETQRTRVFSVIFIKRKRRRRRRWRLNSLNWSNEPCFSFFAAVITPWSHVICFHFSLDAAHSTRQNSNLIIFYPKLHFSEFYAASALYFYFNYYWQTETCKKERTSILLVERVEFTNVEKLQF